MRKMYDMLMYGAYAHAKWDYETSMSILRNKKKMLLEWIYQIKPINQRAINFRYNFFII